MTLKVDLEIETNLTRSQTPEERELSKKLSELSELEVIVAERELDLATLKAELNAFEANYLRTVGVRLAELDEIEARIAEVKARLRPKDNNIQKQARQARGQAQKSAEAIGITPEPKIDKFKPSEYLKKLYREVAKLIHPDLSIDDIERTRRQKLMAQANNAYEEGDEVSLREILNEWENSPESVKGEGTATELVRTIRKIAQIKKRLHVIEIEFFKIKGLDLYDLKIKSEKSEIKGINLLSELTFQVEKKIGSAKNCLAKLIDKEVCI